jgi:hypothetical protein
MRASPWILIATAACSPPPVDAGALTGDDTVEVTSGADTSSTSTSTSSTSGSEEDSTTAAEKLDVGVPIDDPLDHGCSPAPGEMPGGGGKGGSGVAFSNVWVADTNGSTVLKVDTRTLTERARYHTHATPTAMPSRTSVSLNGDVAIANRGQGIDGVAGQSGVTVISTRAETCIDRDGDGEIRTSSGPGDLLPWGDDECVLWHRRFDARSNRPVAWTSGTYDADACRWVDTYVWTATSTPSGRARVLLLDGDDGEVVGDVVIDGWVTDDDRIVYGGAVDSHNDFWFIPPSGDQLGHVRFEDLSYEVVVGPPHGNYGVYVDRADRVLIANGDVSRYDPADETWQTGYCGCTQIAQSSDGRLWTNALVEIDDSTLMPVGKPSASDEMPWGMSFDIDGRLMAIYYDRIAAIAVDSGARQTFYPEGAPFFYTYSDMTGWGLANVVQPEG